MSNSEKIMYVIKMFPFCEGDAYSREIPFLTYRQIRELNNLK